MKLLTLGAILLNCAGLAALTLFVLSMTNWDRDVFLVPAALLAALLLLNLAVAAWAAVYADTSQIARIIRLWLKAKEQELLRRTASPEDPPRG